MFSALVLVVSLAAGMIASTAGFGIGSLLTPVFGLQVSTRVAVAAVSIPHLIGTAWRFWLMRASVDRRVLQTFGLTSCAALLGFDVQREAFVASATAVGLIVDGARLPIYLITEGSEVVAVWPIVTLSAVGVVLGTIFGRRVLVRVPERRFRTTVAVLIAALGVAMLIKGLRS